MSFSAVVASRRGVGGFGVPAVHGKLRLSTSNDEPVNGVTGHNSANFTSKFLYRSHASFPYGGGGALVRIIGNTIPAQRDLAGRAGRKGAGVRSSPSVS